MKIKKYCENRRLEMLLESQSLEKRKQTMIAQGQQLQALLNQVNQNIFKLDVELDVLTKLESSLNGNKEEK